MRDVLLGNQRNTQENLELDRCWSGTGLESPVPDFALSLPAPADRDKDKNKDLKHNVLASMQIEDTTD